MHDHEPCNYQNKVFVVVNHETTLHGQNHRAEKSVTSFQLRRFAVNLKDF